MTTSHNLQAQTYSIPTNGQPPLYTSQDPSPASSASPTSPRMNEYLHNYAPNPAKQLRPLKSPLYVPAVLRPNDYYAHSPMTPPKSLHGSVDSLHESERREHILNTRRDLELALQQQMLRDGELGEVTGPPTREHWKPDGASLNCDSPQCRSSFNLFVRKHHCRHCGHIFCSTHTSYTIPLDQSAKFHPAGAESRACETCHRQFQRWDTARSTRRKNSDESDSSGSQTPALETRMVFQGIALQGPTSQAGEQPHHLANSVPKDWAWSTF